MTTIKKAQATLERELGGLWRSHIKSEYTRTRHPGETAATGFANMLGAVEHFEATFGNNHARLLIAELEKHDINLIGTTVEDGRKVSVRITPEQLEVLSHLNLEPTINEIVLKKLQNPNKYRDRKDATPPSDRFTPEALSKLIGGEWRTGARHFEAELPLTPGEGLKFSTHLHNCGITAKVRNGLGVKVNHTAFSIPLNHPAPPVDLGLREPLLHSFARENEIPLPDQQQGRGV